MNIVTKQQSAQKNHIKRYLAESFLFDPTTLLAEKIRNFHKKNSKTASKQMPQRVLQIEKIL